MAAVARPRTRITLEPKQLQVATSSGGRDVQLIRVALQVRVGLDHARVVDTAGRHAAADGKATGAGRLGAGPAAHALPGAATVDAAPRRVCAIPWLPGERCPGAACWRRAPHDRAAPAAPEAPPRPALPPRRHHRRPAARAATAQAATATTTAPGDSAAAAPRRAASAATTTRARGCLRGAATAAAPRSPATAARATVACAGPARTTAACHATPGPPHPPRPATPPPEPPPAAAATVRRRPAPTAPQQHQPQERRQVSAFRHGGSHRSNM